jgi:exodeoxyribonuclease-3
MKIASWNVNSLNVRLPHVLEWLKTDQADVLALQETKLTDEKFPQEALAQAGWHSCYNGQKTYNGVAILSREEPVDVVHSCDGLDADEKRFIAATYGDVRVLNLYVVNGKAVGDVKYAHKLKWLQHIHQYIAEELKRHPKMIVLGDFNIAPEDRDVHDPEAWEEKILCSTPEREALQGILDLGFSDSFRQFEDEPGHFSWWDYRAAAFRRKMGLRIDLVLVSAALQAQLTNGWIDIDPRRWERPSDHTPVCVELSD